MMGQLTDAWLYSADQRQGTKKRFCSLELQVQPGAGGLVERNHCTYLSQVQKQPYSFVRIKLSLLSYK